jgi:hypothetical protein
MQGLFNDLWENQDVISVNNAMDITLPVGFLIDHLIVPHPGLYRLHFTLLELQVCHSFIISLQIIEQKNLGFGKSVSWKEDDTNIPPGHKMTYKDALQVTISGFVLKVALPDWALCLTPRLRKVKLGFEELHVRR